MGLYPGAGMPPPAPPNVPGYQIAGLLGQGGMATVWRAEQTALGRQVALKVVLPHLLADRQTRARFLREAKANARIVHPNVITCYDAGEAGGQLFMALELVTGGDLRQLVERDGPLEPWRALRLVLDCLNGLAAVAEAGLIHRDIKPSNIFLDGRGVPKLADLGLAKASGGAELTMPGMVVGTPAFIAPEQARAVADLDIRADIYALGATLFHLIAGRTPYPGDDPMGVLVQVMSDPVPDLAAVAPGCPPEIAALARTLMAKERERRPADVAAAIDLAVRTLDGRMRPGTAPPPSAPAPARPASAPPAAERTPPPRAATPPPTAVAIDAQQLAQLARRIIVDQGGLRACLALAPGASFPRWMLDQIIAAAGVVHGLVESSLHAATFPREVPRRLVLARGTPPSPGIAGRSILGEPLPPLATTVSIEVAPDGLQATAYTRPNQLARREDLERCVKDAGLRFGLDPEALRRLVDGPPSPAGRVVVARGRPADPGRAPGFNLLGEVANTTVDVLAGTGNLRKVAAGELIARWDDGIPPKPGMDVLGRAIAAPPTGEATPESCTGAGCEQARDSEGRLALRTRIAGFVQRQPDGCVRVVGIFAVDGDLGPGHPPIVTDDVVVVRGSVLPGASITTASDIVIMGDLHDARIVAGGNVEVDGRIGAGAPIEAAGLVSATHGGSSRSIMAGSLRIAGEVRDCDLRASGDIQVGRVVGGSLVAGGDVRAEVVGDGDGTTTVLWAGRNLTRGEAAKLAELEAKRHDAERSAVMRQRRACEDELARVTATSSRMQGSAYVNQAAARELSQRLAQLAAESERISATDEAARLTLAEARRHARGMLEKRDNIRARIEVGVIAHAGAVMRLADAEAEALKEPRLRLRLGA